MKTTTACFVKNLMTSFICVVALAGPVEAFDIIEVPSPGSGTVHMRAMVYAGSMHEEVGKEGLALFTALFLRRGAGVWSRQELDATLDQMGAGISVSVEKEYTVITGACLKQHLARFYPIFRAVLTAPTFNKSEVALLRQDQEGMLRQIINDNIELGINAFTQALYAGTSYAHPIQGRFSAIESLTAEDASKFFKRFYRHDNLIVGLGGDYQDVEVANREGKKEKLLGAIKSDIIELLPAKGKLTKTTLPKPKKNNHRRVLIVEKEGLEQGQINIGHAIDIRRGHRDYEDMVLFSNHFGAHRQFFGVLQNSVRAARGLTYGAYTYVTNFPQPYATGIEMLPLTYVARSRNDFRMWTFTLVENMEFTIKLMLYKLDEFFKNSIDKERFDLTKKFVANRFVFYHESVDRRLALRMEDSLFDSKPIDLNFNKQVEKISLKSFNKAVKREIHPDQLLIVVTVPDAGAFKTMLLDDQVSVTYQGAIDPKPLAQEDKKVKALPLGVDPKNIEVVSAEALFR